MSVSSGLSEDKSLLEAQAEEDRGYRMITSFDIENFRCFERLNLRDLRTINVIVGDNGSGKTALLEALFLAAHAHPRAITFTRETRVRPLPNMQVTWSARFFQSLWEDLFFNFEDSKLIKLEFTDSYLKNKVRVEVQYVWPESGAAFSGGPIPHLYISRFEVERPDVPAKPMTVALLKINEQGEPVTEGPAIQAPNVYYLPSTSQFFAEDVVDLFSVLSRDNLEDDIIEAMKEDFHQISNISILRDGAVDGLFVTAKSIPNRKVPLAAVSSGAARYLNILIPISTIRRGIVLVDEIENGIYWEKMPKIWQRLRQICIDRGVQLFATTHSDECLQALSTAIRGHERDFSLIRTKITDNKLKVQQVDGEIFLAALEQHGEIR